MKEVSKIASFTVDHTKITPGIYISRIDGDIVTYDMRTRKPNDGNYMDNLTMHSLEHMFATYIRSSDIGNSVIYFGPMGCQTGFYLLVKDVQWETVLENVKSVLHLIISHDGAMFGESEVECGNYRNLSVDAAKIEAAKFLEVLENSNITFEYPS